MQGVTPASGDLCTHVTYVFGSGLASDDHRDAGCVYDGGAD